MLPNNFSLTTSERAVVDESIRKSYLVNGGDLQRTIKETKYPQEYVTKVIQKFRKESKHNVTNLVADKIMEHLLFGYSSRTAITFDLLKKIESQEDVLKSTCCQDIVRDINIDGIHAYECLKCGNMTDVVSITSEEKVSLKLQMIDQLRKEDEAIVKVCEKMGFFETPPQTVIKNQQNFVVMPKGELDEATVKEISALSRVEQDALRLSIEKTISEAEVVEDGEGK